MNKRRLLILICIILVAALAVAMIACQNKPSDDSGTEPDVPPVEPMKLTPTQALDKVYNSLISGGTSMQEMTAYGVENVFAVNMRYLNYEMTYKANYRQNSADSEIYLGLFDVEANLYRIEIYYNAKDLYYRTTDKTHVISNFSSTMAFGTFFDGCRKLDMTGNFFGDTLGTIFNRNNNGVNLGVLLGEQAISYNKAGEGREYVEFSNLDLTVINSDVAFFMGKLFGEVGDKYDLITQKFLNFKLSDIAKSRTEQIHATSLGFGISGLNATDTAWQLTGRMSDADKSNFKLDANVSYSEGKKEIAEAGRFSKASSVEATLGKNLFTGTVLIPAVSDVPFDLEIITDINSKNNMTNQAKLTVKDATGVNFIAGYYKDGQAFLDATGFDKWINGAIDLAALKLPKIYEENVDVTKLISAAYSNLSKIVDMLLDKGLDGAVDKDLYEKVIENLSDDKVNTVYYTVTEELIKAVTGDDTPLISRLAEFLNVDEAALTAFIGEDFFSTAKLIIGYNLDTGEITLTLYKGETMLFKASVFRRDFNGIDFPSDVKAGSLAYSKLYIPDTITMEIEAEFSLGNEKQKTDLSRVLGVMIGDTTGINTLGTLSKTETLILRGEVSEKFVKGADGKTATVNTVKIKLYKRVGKTKTEVLGIRSNPDNENQLFIDYYLPLGKYGYTDGAPVCYRLNKQVLKDGFDELLGENNIFSESNIFTILTTVLSMDGISSITKQEGWFGFSLVVSGENDPVYELTGIKDTTATVKARVFFSPIEQETVERKYPEPVIIMPPSIGVDSIYSDGSAWVDSVDVYFGEKRIEFTPTYTEESITVITGKDRYTPQAFLFGKEITYTMTILSSNGTFKIESLDSNIIIIDPAFTQKLPEKIAVIYDNGERGELSCSVENFFEENITNAGYNMAGFDGDLERCLKSRVVIGKNSIMNVEFDVYVLVHNRTVVPTKNKDGKEMYDKDVPVVAVVKIDPYTYAMRRMAEAGFNPLLDGISNVDLVFNGVYGSEVVEEDGESVTKDLSYDIIGYNRFPLRDTELDWEYDFDKISYRGSLSYAYAYYGNVKIAVQMAVAAQEVDYVRIDDVSDPQNPVKGTKGRYTIDPLIAATYAIPSTTEGAYRVVLGFKNGSDWKDDNDLSQEDDKEEEKKEKILSLVQPSGVSNEDYYDNYLRIRLDWAGADILVKDKTIIKLDNDTDNLFGNGNVTTASFGMDMGVGTQTVKLTVDSPSRYQSPQDGGRQVHAAASCTIIGGEPDFSDSETKWINNAYFPATGERVYAPFEPFEINPYYVAARIPDTIYLRVFKTSSKDKTENNREYKLYNVKWTTTDANGNELNLIEEKADGRFGLKNPVTYQQDFFIYGKIGRGYEDKSDYVWVIATVRNTKSLASRIEYTGNGYDGEVKKITVDPYLPYALPTGFTAYLESGELTKTDIMWYVHNKDDADEERYWYPQKNIDGIQSRYYDKDGNFVFDRNGGYYEIRYVIEGTSSVMRQTVSIDITVESRTVESGTVSIFDITSQPDSKALKEINRYDALSERLLQRLIKLRDDEEILTGIVFKEKREGSVYDVYGLHVAWDRGEKGSAEYAHSIDRLIAMLLTSDVKESDMILYGVIGKGTINEQSLQLVVTFEEKVIKYLRFNRYEPAVRDNEAVNIAEMIPGTVVIDFSAWTSKKLTISMDKPFALTVPTQGGRVYASAYDYLTYLLSQINAEFTDGATEVIRPVIDETTFEEKNINDSLLLSGGNVVIKLKKLSEGSAIDEVTVEITAVPDELRGQYQTITANPYKDIDLEVGETGGERYREGYGLGEDFEVEYKESGVVRYLVPDGKWTIAPSSREYFGGKTQETKIDAELINILSEFTGSQDGNKQAVSYTFEAEIPCTGELFTRTISFPRKDISEVYYNAKAEDEQYDIRNGIIDIANPYAYFREDSEFGIDVKKLPNIIKAQDTDYYETDDGQVSEHYVTWTVNKTMFNAVNFEALMRTGLEIETNEAGYPLSVDKSVHNSQSYFAYCDIDSYFVQEGTEIVKKKQRIYLYIRMQRVNYTGISYGEQNIEKSGDGRQNLVIVDPYDDPMNYMGSFRLPNNGLTVYYNNTSREFDDVTYNIFDKDGVFVEKLKSISFDEHGVSEQYANCVGDDGTIRIEANIPGFRPLNDGDPKAFVGLEIYVKILPKTIEEQELYNDFYNEKGQIIGGNHLPVYYIDPYNDATFAIPSKAWIRFRGEEEFSEHTVNAWSVVDGKEIIPLKALEETDASDSFYFRNSDENDSVKYAYYKKNKDSYRGEIFTLQGYISMGKNSTTGGEAGNQYFTVYVIVLNRSLKEEYNVNYRFDDPLGGLLSDIPHKISEEFFVNCDNDYSELARENDFPLYTDVSSPIVPTISWEVNNSQDVIDPAGGFTKDIEGNVYAYSNEKSALSYKAQLAIDGDFELLTKARIFDACYTENGNPQAYFVSTEHLVKMAREVETAAVYATYLLTVENLSKDPDREIKELGDNLANALINNIKAEFPELTIEEQTEILFNRLKSENKNSQSLRDRVYSAWAKIYSNFKAAGSDYDQNISPYQRIKAEKYDELYGGLTYNDRTRIDERLRASVVNSLFIYRNTAYWNYIFELSSDDERKQMSDIVGVGTTEIEKSKAYLVYMQRKNLLKGNIGETVNARITAPTMKIVELYKNAGLGEGEREEITEFLFNRYTGIAFLSDVDVETLIGYAPILNEYIEKALSLALDYYREDNYEKSIEEYIDRLCAQYVNASIPQIVDPETGLSSPLIEFKYEEFVENGASNAIYWDKLYNYAKNKSHNRIQGYITKYGSDYRAIFDEIRRYHETQGDLITVNGRYCTGDEVIEMCLPYGYTSRAFEEYEKIIIKSDTAVLDGVKAKEQKEVDASLAKLVVDQNSAFGTFIQTIGVGNVFETMFDSNNGNAVGMYDRLYASFNGSATDLGYEIEKLLGQTLNNSKPATFYKILRGGASVKQSIRLRALDIYNWTLCGDKPFTELRKNPSVVGLTEEELIKLVEVFATSAEGVESTYYDAFSDEQEFYTFRNYLVFSKLRASASGSRKNLLDEIFNEATKDKLAKGYENLYSAYDDQRAFLDRMRQNLGDLDAKAFNAYVVYYSQKAIDKKNETESVRSKTAEREAFDKSKEIWEELYDSDSFEFRSQLTPSDDEEAKRKSLEKYRSSFATEEEKIAIDYYVSICPTAAEAYRRLMKRSEFGKSFTDGLDNAYYFVALEGMTDKVRSFIKESIGDDLQGLGSDRQTYNLIVEDVETYFYALFGKNTANDSAEAKERDKIALARFVEEQLGVKLKGYYDRKKAVSDAASKEGLRVAYNGLFEVDAELLDEILLGIYAEWKVENPFYADLGERQYRQFIELIKADELQNYNYVLEKIAKEKGREYVFDDLSVFGPTFDVEETAKLAFESVKNQYDAFTPSVKRGLAAQISASYFEKGENESYAVKARGLLSEVYFRLIEAEWTEPDVIRDANKLKTAIYNAAVGINSGLTAEGASETDRLIAEAVVYAESAKAYVGNENESAATVRTAAALTAISDEIKAKAAEAHINVESVGADRADVGKKKAEYVGIVVDVLTANGYQSVGEYLLFVAEGKGEYYRNFDPTSYADPDYDVELEREIMKRLKLTSDYERLTIDSADGAIDRYDSLIKYIDAIGADVLTFVKKRWENGYQLPSEATDEDYNKLFAEIIHDETKYMTFYTQDSVADKGAEQNRNIIIFDKSQFEANPNLTDVDCEVYVGNAAKLDLSDPSKLKDNPSVKSKRVKYIYYGSGSFNLWYVDFEGDTEVDFRTLNAPNSDKASDNYGKKGEYLDRLTAMEGYGKLNHIEIDPLAPVLPERVRVYGVYTFTETVTYKDNKGEDRTNIHKDQKQLVDLGMMDVENYGQLFYDSVYNGQASEKSYDITLTGNGLSFNVGNISVSYPDRRIDKVYLSDDLYGGSADGFGNMVSLYNNARNTNVITIDPSRRDFLDVYEKQYLMPEKITVVYRSSDNGTREEAEYEDIVWDMSGVEYSLDGLKDRSLRPISYRIKKTVDGVETIRLIEFAPDQDKVKIKEIDLDGKVIGKELEFNGVPDDSVWNLKLDILARTPSELVDADGMTLGVYDASKGYIDIDPGLVDINPYDIVYPERIGLKLGSESQQTAMIDAEWTLEKDANGNVNTNKLLSIINGNAEDRYIIAQFEYLGYVIKARFLTDDISLEVADKDFINGGIIYLVANGTSAVEQLTDSYPYFYYNFGVLADEYRKVPLGFGRDVDNQIDTSRPGITYNVEGCLGWDKQKYPNTTTFRNNISFTVQVVSPAAYPKLNTGNSSGAPVKDEDYLKSDPNVNRFISYDYVSVPYDVNFNKRTDANEPDGPDRLVHFDSRGDSLSFRIDEDSVIYDVLGGMVYYRCEFLLTGGGTVENQSATLRLASDETGNRWASFKVGVKLKGYLYTDVSGVTFDKTPVKDADDNDIWQWRQTDDGDAIVWQLGRAMRASDLPKAVTQNGVSISLTWDLSGVNVNKATTESKEGYQALAYYYDSNGMWNEMPLKIYIEQANIYDQVLNAVGGSLVIERTYNGSHYRLNLDPNSEEMLVLREDGSLGALREVVVEYRMVGENYSDWDYKNAEESIKNCPLNAGKYLVRIRIDDYNATIGKALILNLEIKPYVVHKVLLSFENEESVGEVSYVYNGEERGIKVFGMPEVKVEGWFETAAEKAALVNVWLDGENTNEIAAKQKAYNILYESVTEATKAYMKGLESRIKTEHGWSGSKLAAAVWDELEPALKICEVIPTVTYKHESSDETLSGAPRDVGKYSAVFTIGAEENKNNYQLDSGGTIVFSLKINEPTVTYSPMESELIYSGKPQHPRINGLHDENGNLPEKVVVSYTYKYYIGGVENILTEGVTDVGTYMCSVKIDGGINYPDGELSEFTIKVLPRDLYIDIPVNTFADELETVAQITVALKRQLAERCDPDKVGQETIDGIISGATNAERIAELFDEYMTGDALKDILDEIAREVGTDYVRLLAESLGGDDGEYLSKLADLIDRRSGNGVLKDTALFIIRGGGEKRIAEITGNVINVVGSEYLQELTDVTRFIKYHGLVGGDKPSSFGVIDMEMGAKDYYTIGIYGIMFNGFKLREDSEVSYTYKVPGTNGYSRIELKPYGQDGSILGRVEYNSLRNLFSNYNIYVSERSEYRIIAEEGAITVANSQELQRILDELTEGSKAVIYLMPQKEIAEDGTEKLLPNVFENITINVNAGVTIVGCYDADRNILTEIKGINVIRGAVNLRMLSFKAQGIGDVGLTIGEKAGDITVNDCEFDGGEVANAVAVKTDRLFVKKLYVGGTTIRGYQSGIVFDGGDIELGSGANGGNVFENNGYGLRITSDGNDIRVAGTTFVGQSVGIYCENPAAVIIDSKFDYNRTAIRLVGVYADDIRKQNEFGEYNGVNIDDSEL